MTELSDELLVAYVDGQLAGDQSVAVERVLKYDQVAAERVAALKSAYARLETAFDSLLEDEHAQLVPITEELEEVEPVVAGPVQAFPDQKTIGFLAATAAGLLLLGGVTGYLLQGAGPPAMPKAVASETAPVDWRHDAALAQALMSRETLEVALQNQSNVELVGFQIGKSIGGSAIVPNLESGGLAFKRAQMLQFQGAPVVQMLYLPKEGPPVALFARKSETDNAPTLGQQFGDVQVVSWAQKGVEYALIATASEARLRQLAETVRKQLAGS